jgi:nitroimidazol reductase NimA-like FMN-containing flavoprotein (pyridoxamine 5'-phosphate oxidase superfamily)
MTVQIRELDRAECASILDQGRLGMLACAKDGIPYVVPVHFAHADNALFAFSMPGRKIDFMRANPHVCVFVEQRETGRLWRSVVVNGRYEELPDRVGFKRQRDHAWRLLSQYANWWEPGALKPAAAIAPPATSHIFFRIAIETVSGREAVD